MRVEAKQLVRKLTPSATRALEAAVGRAAGSGFYEITVEHLLLALSVVSIAVMVERWVFYKRRAIDIDGGLIGGASLEAAAGGGRDRGAAPRADSYRQHCR